MDFRKTYQDGKQNGFAVTDARQYYENDNEKDVRVETWIQTPYFFEGEPVKAYGVVNIESWDLNRGRTSNTLEFWQNGRNLEDVMEQSFGTREVQLQDANGKDLDMKDAYQQIGDFAKAASEYPHVFLYDEYVASRTPINERLKLDAPNEAMYEKYLESVERQMESGDVEFVGQMTNPSSLHMAYTSMPSVQAEMQEEMTRMDRAAELDDYAFEESDMVEEEGLNR